MLAIAQTAIAFVDGEEYDALLHSHEEGDETVLEDGYYRWLASIVDRIVSANKI